MLSDGREEKKELPTKRYEWHTAEEATNSHEISIHTSTSPKANATHKW